MGGCCSCVGTRRAPVGAYIMPVGGLCWGAVRPLFAISNRRGGDICTEMFIYRSKPVTIYHLVRVGCTSCRWSGFRSGRTSMPRGAGYAKKHGTSVEFPCLKCGLLIDISRCMKLPEAFISRAFTGSASARRAVSPFDGGLDVLSRNEPRLARL